MVINLNVPNTPAPRRHKDGIVMDGRRHIHDVVAEFTPPGFTTPQLTQTSADDWKVASERDD